MMRKALPARQGFFYGGPPADGADAMILTIQTRSRVQFVDVTAQVQETVSAARVADGLCMLFVPHTTAGVTINESADPAVAADILRALDRMVPLDAGYTHLEGNSPAHVKATLVGASQCVGIAGGRLVLGTWQGIFFCEFDGPRRRKLHVRCLPDHRAARGVDGSL